MIIAPKYLILAGILFLLGSCNQEVEQIPEEKIAYSELKQVHRDELLQWNKELAQTDKLIIEKFIDRRNWEMEMTETGLFYHIYHKTNGIGVSEGNWVEFKYTTSLLDGTVVYSSDESGNRVIHIGRNDDEFGLDEGLRLMNIGEKARFILHPFLAFGLPGDGYKIPMQAILLYEVEVVDVRETEIK
jgi:FKBP-type peptidyl-prolyl cis-trans isomerase FkpA